MSEKNVSVNCGFLNLLTLLFVGLKLTGYINWSWFWVLSPTIIPLGIFLAIISLIITAKVIR